MGDGSTDEIKQEIVSKYLSKNWGLEKQFLNKDNPFYILVSPSGVRYPLQENIQFRSKTGYDIIHKNLEESCFDYFSFEDTNTKIIEELEDANLLTRMLRSIRDSSVLDCLIDIYKTFTTKP